MNFKEEAKIIGRLGERLLSDTPPDDPDLEDGQAVSP